MFSQFRGSSRGSVAPPGLCLGMWHYTGGCEEEVKEMLMQAGSTVTWERFRLEEAPFKACRKE